MNMGAQQHLVFATLALIYALIGAAADVITLDSSTLSLARRTDEMHLSFTIDSSYIQNGWIAKNLGSDKVVKLASPLAPAYLRVGGTYGDALVFSEASSADRQQSYPSCSGHDCKTSAKPQPRAVPAFNMTASDWTLINNFATKAGLHLIFGLNALRRSGSSWDPSNAKQLLNFSNTKGFNVSWQLGNEPDLFSSLYGTQVSAQQLAKDFSTARALLNSYPRYKASLLVGPDVFSSDQYLREFLAAQGTASVSAASFHQYYLNGDNAKVQDFYNPSVLNSLVSQLNAKKTILSETHKNLPLWMTETSSAYKGGAKGISDRFVAGFLWLDKLALAAKAGADVVCRQDFVGSNYGLVDEATMEPNPDWWLSVLYKKLVGAGVLNTPVPAGAVRLYAQCSKTHRGAIVLFGMNLDSKEADVTVKGSLTSQDVSAYVLTGETGLLSQRVLLNGARLQLLSNNALPTLKPVRESTSSLRMPAYSMAFYVFEDANVSACH